MSECSSNNQRKGFFIPYTKKFKKEKRKSKKYKNRDDKNRLQIMHDEDKRKGRSKPHRNFNSYSYLIKKFNKKNLYILCVMVHIRW